MAALAVGSANERTGWATTVAEEAQAGGKKAAPERKAVAVPRRIAVAVNDSEEARYALEWTIEHVFKEEDSIVLIYSVLPHHEHHEDHHNTGEKKTSCDSVHISKGWQILHSYSQRCKSAGLPVRSQATKISPHNLISEYSLFLMVFYRLDQFVFKNTQSVVC
jgi:hypothetical protein